MTQARVTIDGDLYLTLEAIAQCYRVEVAWLRRAYDAGVLGPGRQHERTVLLAARRLDRVAAVVRLSLYYSLDLEAMAALIGSEADEGQ